MGQLSTFSIELVWSGLISLVLVGLGAYYLVHETIARRRAGGYLNLPPADRKHFQRQCARRRLGSTLLILAGVAIFVGQNLVDWRRSPRLYGWIWIGVMLGLLGIIVQAAADLVAIRRYARRHRQQLAAGRREMIARQLEQIRAARREDDPPATRWTPEQN